jgi:hypothetical protein
MWKKSCEYNQARRFLSPPAVHFEARDRARWLAGRLFLRPWRAPMGVLCARAGNGPGALIPLGPQAARFTLIARQAADDGSARQL